MHRRVSKPRRATQAAARPQLCRANPSVAVTAMSLGPVDTLPCRRIVPSVSKRRKVDEPQAPYAARKPAKAAASPKKAAGADAEFKRITAKPFAERKELLQTLAQ